MAKKLFLVTIIVILIISNVSIRSFQKKFSNTYTNRDNITDESNIVIDNYNIEEESIRFVYKFFNNWQDKLTSDYLEESIYNMYSGELKYKLVDYIKNLEVVDKLKNEIVLVKSGTAIDNVTNKQYVKLTLYVAAKEYEYTSEGASVILGNSPDSNKKFTIMVYSDKPYDFKIKFLVENNLPNDNGRS